MADETLLERPNMLGRIHKVREKTEAIWKKPLLPQYTDHTVEHSLRVMSILDKLCSLLEERLTDDEAYVLLCAAYLHDIGMQQEKFYEMDVIKKRYSEEEIAVAQVDQSQRDNVIREWHHLIGEERIRNELGAEYMEEEFIDEIAVVSKGHTRENLDDYEDVTKAGSSMRLRLLAALLRLADELDLDYRRVDLHEFEQAIVPDKSKAHWWQCHYVESVDLEPDGSVRVSFRFPAEDGEEATDVVPRLVLDRLRRKLDQDKLLNVLWPHIRIKLEETPKILSPGTTKQPVPGEVMSILKGELLELSLQRARESMGPVTPFASGTVSITIGETPDGIMKRGTELLQAGQKEEALATLERGASRFASSAPVQAMLADAYNQHSRFEDAEKAAQRAVDSDPGHFLGRLCLGIAHSHQGNPELALEHLQIAELVSYSLILPPTERQRLHLAVARSFADLGDHLHARQRLSAAAEVSQRVGMPAGHIIEAEMASIADIIEGELDTLEFEEGQWLTQDLALEPVLGQWTPQAPFFYAGPTITGEGILLGGDSSWLDYSFECEFQLIHNAAGFFVRADARGLTGIMMQFTSSRLRRHQKQYSNYFLREITEVELPIPLERHDWYRVRFEASGTVLKTYLNGQMVDEWTDLWLGYTSGKVGLRVHMGEVAAYRMPTVIVTKKAVPKFSESPAP